MSTEDRSQLRPLERAVLRHVDSGMPETEIAWRFRRTPRFVHQVRQLSAVPGRVASEGSSTTDGLRPVERCVLKARRNGAHYAEIAARLRRTPEYVERVERYADYKLHRGRTAT